MVAIQPFRALRYAPELVGGLDGVVAPPYDIIDAAEQERLYQASPHNIVRLILGRYFPSDTEQDNRYTRARRDFLAWREQGVLRRDPDPAVYLVEHAFRDDAGPRTRLGFIALLGLDDDTPRAVYRHEATLAAPKADRLKLLEAVPANLSPIFCVYPDAEGAIQAALQRLAAAPPQMQVDFNGEAIRCWVVSDPGTVSDLARRLASASVLIADGHHRFEVAWSQRARSPAVMTYFVSMADPALRVRPIHRIVHDPRASDPKALSALCALEPARDPEALLEWLAREEDPAAGGSAGRFGYWDGRTCYRLTVQPDALARWLMAPTVPLPLAALDVSILHGLLWPQLGVDQHRVTYAANPSDAMRAIPGPGAGSAWLLRGLPLAQVFALAAQGFTLPPKSTYFYPKVLSGLAINPLD